MAQFVDTEDCAIASHVIWHNPAIKRSMKKIVPLPHVVIWHNPFLKLNCAIASHSDMAQFVDAEDCAIASHCDMAQPSDQENNQ